jgi:hypothetical protein
MTMQQWNPSGDAFGQSFLLKGSFYRPLLSLWS